MILNLVICGVAIIAAVGVALGYLVGSTMIGQRGRRVLVALFGGLLALIILTADTGLATMALAAMMFL